MSPTAMSRQQSLESQLEVVRARIAAAARDAGRDPVEIELIAVTKEVAPEIAADLVRLGQRDLGENRADELERKATHLRALGLAPTWHFIGHVQTNKARRIVALADVIHSVDSKSLLARIDSLAVELERAPQVFLQVKLAEEDTKTGLDPKHLDDLVESAWSLRATRLRGLMVMAPLGPGSLAKPVFDECARLARRLAESPRSRCAFSEEKVRLSMGMSQDFEDAIAAGSDCVRIGSLLFDGEKG